MESLGAPSINGLSIPQLEFHVVPYGEVHYEQSTDFASDLIVTPYRQPEEYWLTLMDPHSSMASAPRGPVLMILDFPHYGYDVLHVIRDSPNSLRATPEPNPSFPEYLR